MSEEIEDLKDWITRLKQVSLEGTIFLFLGIFFMLIGVINSNSNYGPPLTTAGGFLFIGGVLFISFSKINK